MVHPSLLKHLPDGARMGRRYLTPELLLIAFEVGEGEYPRWVTTKGTGPDREDVWTLCMDAEDEDYHRSTFHPDEPIETQPRHTWPPEGMSVNLDSLPAWHTTHAEEIPDLVLHLGLDGAEEVLEATFPMIREQVMLRTQSEQVVEVMSKVAPLFLTPPIWIRAMAQVIEGKRAKPRAPLTLI